MDSLLTWAMAGIAAISFTLAYVFDYMSKGTEFSRNARLFLFALALVAWGTFLVSTFTGFDIREGSKLVAALNRAVLAGTGLFAMWRSWDHMRNHPRVNSDR